MSLRPRQGMMKLQLPRAPSVMKQMMEISAITARMVSTRAGRDGEKRVAGAAAVSVPMATRPQQEIAEDHAAHDPPPDADGNFVGHAHEAPDDIAGEDEGRAPDRDPGHGARHV